MSCIEGNPFITRFKTFKILTSLSNQFSLGIEGNPFITRFKTPRIACVYNLAVNDSIEGNPFITRFKTTRVGLPTFITIKVLKVIHL